LFLLIASVAKDFRNYDEVSQSIAVAQPTGGKLNIRVDEPRIRYSGSFDWINDDDRNEGGWDLTDDTLRLSNVKMRFIKSTDSSYHVTLWKYSRGRNRADAAGRAERLSYNAALQGNALVLGSGYGIGKAQKFRAQQVIIEVSVPVGRQVRFDESVQAKLRPTYYNMRNNHRSSNYDWERDWDFDERYGANFELQTGVDYTMTESGELVDASQRTTTDSTDAYRYKGDSLDNQIQELQRQRDEENRRRDEEIERQRQRVEEENRRLQELQNTSNTTENTSRVKRLNQAKPTIETTGIHTPIFSLII
jgi:hypothetical protein